MLSFENNIEISCSSSSFLVQSNSSRRPFSSSIDTGVIKSCSYFVKLASTIRSQFSLMPLLCHRTRLKSRYILSICVGLCLGFALSLACLPLMSVCENPLTIFTDPFSSPFSNPSNSNESLSLAAKFDPFRIILNRQARSLTDMTLVDYPSPDYEPRILPIPSEYTANKSQSSSLLPADTPKVTRPRYIADELGIKEKVLVAVLTEPAHLNTFALFLNQSLQDYVNRLLFFIDDDVAVQDVPRGMQVIALNDKRAYLKPFYVLKYLAEKMIKSYDWFVLMPDKTFVRGFQVRVLFFQKSKTIHSIF